MNKNDRISKLFDYIMTTYNMESQKDLADKLCYSVPYISQIKNGTVALSPLFMSRIKSVFPQVKISERWLVTGEGNMFDGETCEINEDMEYKQPIAENEIPVIPCDIVRQPDINVWEYISNNVDNIEHLTLSQLFPDHDLLHRVVSNAMQPSIEKGDVLVLRRLPQTTQIINGECYVVDTLSLGLLIRIVEDKGDSLLCSATSGNYNPITIHKSDVCNVFSIVGLIRQNIAPVANKEPALMNELKHRSEQIDNLIDEVKCQGKRMDKVLKMIEK